MKRLMVVTAAVAALACGGQECDQATSARTESSYDANGYHVLVDTFPCSCTRDTHELKSITWLMYFKDGAFAFSDEQRAAASCAHQETAKPPEVEGFFASTWK